MNKRINLSRFIYVFAFCLIIIPACDLRKEYSEILYYLGVGLLLLKSGISIIKANKFIVTKDLIKIFITWLILVLCFFPGYATGNITFGVILQNIFLFLIYFVLFARCDMEISDVLIAAVISNLYFAYRCFFQIGVVPALYQGTVTNPNQMALVMVGGVIGSLFLTVTYDSYVRFFGVFMLCISFVIVFFTSCRSVILLSVAAVFIYLYYYFSEVKNVNFFSSRKISKKGFFIFLFLLILIIGAVWIFRENISVFLFQKWGEGTTTVLSGRNDLWNMIFKNVSLTGNYSSDVNANNDYLDWLLKYGVLSFAVYMYMLLACLKMTIRKYKHNKKEYIWHFIIVILYLAICLVENIHAIFGKSFNVLFWFALGSVVSGIKTNIQSDIDE